MASKTKRARQRAAAEQTRAQGKVTGAPSPIQVPRPLSQRILRIGGSLTPADITAFFRLADTGYIYKQCDLAEEARLKDCHLQGILYRRETAVSTIPWQVVPATEKRKDIKIALFVERVLRELGEAQIPGIDLQDLPSTFVHLNSSILPGFAVCEVPWEKRDGFVVPMGTIPIGARRFVFSQIDGSLRWYDVTGGIVSNPSPGIDLRADYPVGRFLVHRPRYNGAEGPREGMVRPLMWAALFRNWAIGDWLQLGELAWKPYRTGKYPRGASDEDIAALDYALETLTSNGWARLPEACALSIEFAKGLGDSKVHEALAAFLAAEMSKLILGATLTVEQGRTGAMALGSVHADVAKNLRDMDCRAIEATVRRQLITPLVQRNFGMRALIPEFRFLTEDGADLEKLASAIDKLVGPDGKRLALPQSYVRDAFGFPEPESGDVLMGGEVYVPVADREKPLDVVVPAEGDDASSTDDSGLPDLSNEAMARAVRTYRLDKIRRAVHSMWKPTTDNRIATTG